VVFQIFAREDCPVCTKAQDVLNRVRARFDIEVQVRYVQGASTTADNLADMAWHDWTDSPPVVVAIKGDQVLKRWDGNDIADTSRSWQRMVERWLEEQRSTSGQSF